MKKAAKARKPAKKKSARKPNAAFMRPLTPSAALAAIVGAAALPRTSAVSKTWVYIKKNNLQDAKNRRMINTDDKLGAVCGGKKQVSMFDLTKHLSTNLS
ncbi:MAG TPA: SWIB/MDM2 domain-containing protein [Opitutaceae bacterium]